VDDGLVLASDSRTNAGVDQVSTYSKMHAFGSAGEWMVTLLSSGNLATTQAVTRQVRRDIENGAAGSLAGASRMAEAAEYIGELNLLQQRKHAKSADESFNPEASFIVAGQYAGQPAQLYLVYPEGNYIRASRQTPFLQIGESKYGKPILDRIIDADVDMETAARCALVSMDSSMRSNLSVGPPIELLLYRTDSLSAGEHFELDEDDEYLRRLRQAWEQELKEAFSRLPRLPGRDHAMRLVD
jgi:putative proteasome-type protease